jgi:hypothetical protein
MEYIKKFVKGELSLGHTYWVSFGIVLFLLAIEKSLIKDHAPITLLVIVGTTFVIVRISTSIGIWKSAGFYILNKSKNKESSFWGYVAQIIVCLYLITLFFKVVYGFLYGFVSGF